MGHAENADWYHRQAVEIRRRAETAAANSVEAAFKRVAESYLFMAEQEQDLASIEKPLEAGGRFLKPREFNPIQKRLRPLDGVTGGGLSR
jgi:hypothetical protein